jgi:hypothetical protein
MSFPLSNLNIIKEFHGKEEEDAHAWLQQLKNMAELNGWDEATCVRVAKVRLAGTACTWVNAREFAGFNDFCDMFLERFGPNVEVLLTRLQACKQLPGESVRTYVDRFRQLAHRAESSAESRLLRLQLIKGFLNPALRKELALRRFETVAEIADYAAYAEEWNTLENADATAPPVAAATAPSRPATASGHAPGNRPPNDRPYDSRPYDNRPYWQRNNDRRPDNQNNGQRNYNNSLPFECPVTFGLSSMGNGTVS